MTFDDLTSLTTAIGVGVASYQIWQTRLSLRDNFERTFVDRYQRIAEGLPVEVFLGGAATDVDPAAFYRYFELCEEQLYYRAFRRVSARTWRDWWYGMSVNMASPAFADAFEGLTSAGVERTARRFVYLTAARPHLGNARYVPRRLSLVHESVPTA